MIIYATRETFKRYKLKMPEEMDDMLSSLLAAAVIHRESGDKLMEWGCKLFYFDRRKCIQVINFASKLTLVFCDIKLADVPEIGNILAYTLMDLYKDDKEMTGLLERWYGDYPSVAFSRLTDKTMIATLNSAQTNILFDGYRLYDYLQDEILHTRKFNRYINEELITSEKVDGNKEWFFRAKRFKELLQARYAEK